MRRTFPVDDFKLGALSSGVSGLFARSFTLSPLRLLPAFRFFLIAVVRARMPSAFAPDMYRSARRLSGLTHTDGEGGVEVSGGTCDVRQ